MKRFFPALFFLLFVIASVLMPVVSFGQIVDAGCDPFDPTCPIDGGLSLLIAAGIGLGAKKAYQERKKVLANKD